MATTDLYQYPSDELFFCYSLFSEIKSFIRIGMPDHFRQIVEDYPFLKFYYAKKGMNELCTDSKQNHIVGCKQTIGDWQKQGIYHIGNQEFECVGLLKDMQTFKFKKIIGLDKDGKRQYESLEIKFKFYQWGNSPVNPIEKDVYSAIVDFFKIIQKTFENDSYGDLPNRMKRYINLVTGRDSVSVDLPSIANSFDPLFTHLLYCLGFNLEGCGDLNAKINSYCGNDRIMNSYKSNFRNILHLVRNMRNKEAHEAEQKPNLLDECKLVLYTCIAVIYFAKKAGFSFNDKNTLNPCLVYCTVNEEKQILVPFMPLNGTSLTVGLNWDGARITTTPETCIVQKKIYCLRNETRLLNDLLAKVLKDSHFETNEQIQKVIELLEDRNEVDLLADCREKILEEIRRLAVRDVSRQAIIEEVKKWEKEIVNQQKRKATKNKCLITGTVLLILFLGVLYVYRLPLAEHLYKSTHKEVFCWIAYQAGSRDIAYDHAQWLERHQRIRDAVVWFRNARERYLTLTKVHSNGALDVDCLFRLAKLYMEGKGGEYSPQKALWYASQIKHTAKGIGLYTLYNMQFNPEEARDGLVLVQEKYREDQKDDYMRLAESVWQLTDPKLPAERRKAEYYEAAFDTLKKMAETSNSMQGEVQTLWASLYLNGFYRDESRLVYSLFDGMTLLTRAALEENFVPAQSALGDIYAQMGLWNDAASFYSLSVANGYRANMGKLIELSQLIGAPRHLIDSLMEEKERYSVDTFNATMETAELLTRHEEMRTAIRSLEKRKEAVDAFDPMKHWVEGDFFVDFIRELLKSTASVEEALVSCDSFLVGSDADRQIIKTYLLGVKYAQGYGVERNQLLADSLIQTAAGQGSIDAIYTWGRLLDQRGRTQDAIKTLQKTADVDSRSAEWLSYMFQNVDQRQSEKYLAKADDSVRLYRTVREELAWLDTLNVRISAGELEERANRLEAMIARNGFADQENCFCLIGELSLLYTYLGYPDMWKFYSRLPYQSRIKNEGYKFLLPLSVFFMVQGKMEESADCYISYCEYLFAQKKQEMHPEERQLLVEYLRWHYPASEDSLRTVLGYDFTKGIEKTEPVDGVAPAPVFRVCPSDSVYLY